MEMESNGWDDPHCLSFVYHTKQAQGVWCYYETFFSIFRLIKFCLCRIMTYIFESRPYSTLDCVAHGLLLTPLKSCGLSYQAGLLLKLYISCSKQEVKVRYSRSKWGSVAQGVLQGSILGPLICNIFINDIFYVLEKVSNLYNYADDNTLLNTRHSVASLKYNLETSGTITIYWFDINGMKWNQTEFQAVLLNDYYLEKLVIRYMQWTIALPILCNNTGLIHLYIMKYTSLEISCLQLYS